NRKCPLVSDLALPESRNKRVCKVGRVGILAGPEDVGARARENTLLYQDIPYLNNAVYLNQLASRLNDCSETIKLQKLTCRIDDPIITKQNLPQVPYFFIKELRSLNSTLHVKDDKFHQERQAANHPAPQ